ncbi:MAG: nucleotide sugar dehydrogenase [Candidatus Bathyarchaeota archaeon]|nr:nucleotide sugar dehydrogenase [Candidatus Bathyarchaeota archaeon]
MKVAIIGSGIVGQATGMGFATNGNTVIFHDINEEKLAKLTNLGYKTSEDLTETVTNSQIIFVCVPTPTVDNKIVLTHIQDCTRDIGSSIKKTKRYKLIVFRSTIPPQTTRTKLIPSLEISSGMIAGNDFDVCTNPEFLREKTPLEDFLNPNRIIIGELNKRAGSVLQELYSPFRCPIIRTDLDTAEMIKYVSNVYLATKISFFNEIFLICQRLGLDARIVSEAVSLDPRIGNYGVTGGTPFAGMCLPKDLTAFIEFTNAKGINSLLLRAVAEVNQEMCSYCSISHELQVPREEYIDISSN